MIKNDLVLTLLFFEWWLGSQKWLRAKSSIALIILIFTVVFYLIVDRFKKKEF